MGWGLFLAVAALACKKGKPESDSRPAAPPMASAPVAATPASVGAEFADKLEPRLAAIEKAGASLPPRIRHGYLKLEPGKVLGDSAEYIHADDMRDLTYPPTPFQTYRVKGSQLFLSCARATRKNDASIKDPRALLERCTNAEHLVVIRTAKLEEPKSYSGVNFIGGKAEGDVLIYSLPKMKLVGGFPYSAQSSKQVHQHQIEEDMQKNLAAAMKEGLKKLHPESKLYFVM